MKIVRGTAILPQYSDLFYFQQSCEGVYDSKTAMNLPHREDYLRAKFHTIWWSRSEVMRIHTFRGFIFIYL